MEKMKMESVDMISHNIALLQKIFPNCVTESLDENGVGKLSVDMEILRQMLTDTVLPGDEAYQLSWVGKKAAIVEANKSIRRTLRPVISQYKDSQLYPNLYFEK